MLSDDVAQEQADGTRQRCITSSAVAGTIKRILASSFEPQSITGYMVEENSHPTIDYQSASGAQSPRWWAIVLSAPVPTLIIAAYIVLTRWPSKHFTVLSDSIAFVAAICVGVGLLAKSRLKRNVAVVSIGLYVPVQAIWIFIFGLEFVCRIFAFGRCI
jgi:hypothetical protein